MGDLDRLKPRVRRIAEELIAACRKKGIEILITSTYRGNEEQNDLYAKGRTKPGPKVTNAKAGESLHNYGIAFDICPLVKGKPAWKAANLFRLAGKIGASLGLEWGGSWKSFPDLPHFQFTAGYKISDFQNNRIDWKKFE